MQEMKECTLILMVCDQEAQTVKQNLYFFMQYINGLRIPCIYCYLAQSPASVLATCSLLEQHCIWYGILLQELAEVA